MRTAIYARVSTFDKGQDPGLQLNPLLDSIFITALVKSRRVQVLLF